MSFLLGFILSCEIHLWWFEMRDVFTEYIWEPQEFWVWRISNFDNFFLYHWNVDSNILNFFCQVGSLELKGSADSRCNGGEAGMPSSSPTQPLVCSPACPSPKRAAVRATVREQPLRSRSHIGWRCRGPRPPPCIKTVWIQTEGRWVLRH